MPRVVRPLLLLAPLALLFAAAVSATAGPLPARALADSVAARYAAMSSFHFAGTTRTSMAGGNLTEPFRLEMDFTYAARMPSRVHFVMDSPTMSSSVVSDGESLWVWAPKLQQYVKQGAPRLVPGQPVAGPLGAALQPLQAIATLTSGIDGVEDDGTDTLATDAGAVTCRRLRVSYPQDSSADAPRVLPRVLWIDEARRLVLRDSITVEFDAPQLGRVHRVQDMRFVHAVPDAGGPDSLYAFAPPAGAKRVRHFGNGPEPPPSPLLGKPAPDFTLQALNGPAVSLAKQRGKVVVLDFWATWCGPCRRWMPVVAGIERELRGRDVRFFAVNLAEPPGKVREFLATAGTTPPVLLDSSGSVGGAYGASSIPLTVVIGRDGKVVQVLLGLHPEEDLRDAIAAAGIAAR